MFELFSGNYLYIQFILKTIKMNSEIYKIFKVLSYVAQLEYFKSAGLLNENLTSKTKLFDLNKTNLI